MKTTIKDESQFRMESYYLEFSDAKWLLLFVFIVFPLLFVIFKSSLEEILIVLSLLIPTLMLTGFRLPILILVDSLSKKTKTVTSINIDYNTDEYSWFGDYWGDSKIGKHYPAPLAVSRQKLIFIKENGKKIKLRNISSAKRIGRIYQLYKFPELDKDKGDTRYDLDKVELTYLPLSKILVHVDVDKTQLKGRSKKEVEEIQSIIRNINTLI